MGHRPRHVKFWTWARQKFPTERKVDNIMECRQLGKTGVQVSQLAFGAGPVSQLLVGDVLHEQRQTVLAAIDSGINWFDTAAGYGAGRSEENLGRIFSSAGVSEQVHVATKVRVQPNQLSDIGNHVRNSVLASLRRLRMERVTLMQLHNAITTRVGELPMSLTPAHVLSPGGVLETLDDLRQEGVIEHIGLTALGDTNALQTVLASGPWTSIQIPYHLLNQSAGRDAAEQEDETDHGNLITHAARRGVAAFAIRVLAGGALAGQPPSPHTLTTPFFPLDLYQRDSRRAQRLATVLPEGMTLEEAAIRFALSHVDITSAIIGFANPQQVRAAVAFAERGPLDAALVARFNDMARTNNDDKGSNRS